MNKKIIITGATGLIGSRLTAELVLKDIDVSVFTRNIPKARSIVPAANKYIEWDYHNPEKWSGEFENTYAVIHLAGASIAGKRFTDSYKEKVKDSRIISTRNIVKAISSVKNKPEVFICASGINYYGDSGDNVLTEDSSKGNDFLADVCEGWENEAAEVERSGVRRVSIRSSPVLSSQDGMLKTLMPLFKFGLGASLGSGRQWFSWIHIDDMVNTYLYALENESVSGPVNATAPLPVSMEGFAKQFGKVLHRPVFLKVPVFALKAVIGEAADFITASLRVQPEKLQSSGFNFRYPELYEALVDIVENKK